MKHNYFILLFLTVSFFGFAQTTILCEGVSTYLKFESEEYVPSVTENDDGTFTLLFSEDYITNIFAKYEIYEIRHVFASSNSESLQNMYVLNFDSQNLIIESQQNVSSDIFYFPHYPLDNSNTAIITEEIISTLDGNSFYVTKYNSIGEGSYSEPMQNVPEDFKLKVTFNYDISKGILYAENDGVSPCGNEFSIGLFGVTDYTDASNEFEGLNLWETMSITTSPSEYSQPCHNIEYILYYTLGLCPSPDFSFPTYVEIDKSEEASRVTLRKDTAVFGQEVIELSQSLLSIKENSFEQIKLITSKNNQYPRFTNLKNSKYYIEVFSILGEKIIKKTLYQKNTISLNSFQSGLYIIKLYNSNNDYKTFKYQN
ncbi:hypothetical protein DIS18_07040 [Algibacter marinivivus]|uniref:Uncharacterized protein n=1 Tax=Algibacter marinivivus TaxID=2100723 RepID=A0A2U2X942_9FLAO|nr:T9SS type A sorting domain-containing protein [Algibacter marinivivus]PWH84284.1 hypothetical protein DIS18_07040 [Algibacter marinivivus]